MCIRDRAPGAPKRAPFGPKCPLALNFHGPILCRNFFSKYRLVGCPENRSGMLCSSSTVIAHIEPPSLRKRPKRGKKGPFWPEKVLSGTSEVLGGPRGTRFGPNCPRLARLSWTHGHHFDLVSGLSWAPEGPKRAPFGPKCPLALNFHGPILCGIFFFKYRLVGCPEHRSGMLCSSSTVKVHIEPPSLRKRPKRDKKGSF